MQYRSFLVKLKFDLNEFDESRLTKEYIERVCKKQLERKGVEVKLIGEIPLKPLQLNLKGTKTAKCQSCGSENLKLIDEDNDLYLCEECGNTQTPML